MLFSVTSCFTLHEIRLIKRDQPRRKKMIINSADLNIKRFIMIYDHFRRNLLHLLNSKSKVYEAIIVRKSGSSISQSVIDVTLTNDVLLVPMSDQYS